MCVLYTFSPFNLHKSPKCFVSILYMNKWGSGKFGTHFERSYTCSMRRTHVILLDYGGHQGYRIRFSKIPLIFDNVWRKGRHWWRQKSIRKKSRYISTETHSTSSLDGKPLFSVELCKRKHCICVQRASLRKSSGHRLHSKWPEWWREWALFQID